MHWRRGGSLLYLAIQTIVSSKLKRPLCPTVNTILTMYRRSLVRLSLPGQNLKWPEGTLQDRQTIFAEHLRDNAGLLYFLQRDEAVPERFQQEALQWGWCKDEFQETDYLPPQLYVREARRMVGQYVYSQLDSEHAIDNEGRDARAYTCIAMQLRCRITVITVTALPTKARGLGANTPAISHNPVPPYQIPYGVIVPKEVANLLVCGAVSSTHIRVFRTPPGTNLDVNWTSCWACRFAINP